MGRLGRFLHEYRDRNPYFARPDKGFFDMADIAFLLEPDICRRETLPAPEMTRYMYFRHTREYGDMMRASDIDAERTWDIFYRAVERIESITK